MRWNDLKRGYVDRVGAMAKLSPYELLGVDLGCSQQEVKAAYLRLVKAYHPDHADPFMVQHNQEVTKLLNVAYESLKDTQ
jgi:DnaJ-class molecular chaperone